MTAARAKAFYRCGCCRAARTLKREVWQYLRPPKCKNCGAVDWRVDNSRFSEWKLRKGPYQTCTCDGLHYPHRRASVTECVHHEAYAYGKPRDNSPGMEYVAACFD